MKKVLLTFLLGLSGYGVAHSQVCESYAEYSGDSEIFKVTVNGGSTNPTFANTGSCENDAPGAGSVSGTYSNFLTLPAITSVTPGQTVSYSVEVNDCEEEDYYDNSVGIWIDFNQNDVLDDAGELIFAEADYNATPRTVSGTFVVPGDAVPGNTIMRVICTEDETGAGLEPCLLFYYGETEDHLINIACPTLNPLVADEGVCIGNDATIEVTPTSGLSTITWWDAASGGTQIATGATFTVTGVTADSTVYMQEDFTGCPSSPRVDVSILVSDVDVTLEAINATCNGLANGSFEQTAVTCGTPGFTYSVDNGAFGTIPTNLGAGVHTVVVKDALGNESVAYNVVITEPGAPTDLDATDVGYFVATLSWTAQGDETDWTVEYGPAGFTPGTGEIIPNATNPQTISGLDPSTEYEFYVSAGCVANSDVAGPFAFTTNTGFATYDNNCGPGFIDISTTGEAIEFESFLGFIDYAEITTDFPITYQDASSSTMTVLDDGAILFGDLFGAVGEADLFYQDIEIGDGEVYQQTVNVGGDNLFIVQWNNVGLTSAVSGQTVTFEFIYNETTGEMFYIYDDAIFGGSQDYADNGADAGIAVFTNETEIIVSDYDDTYLSNNSCIRFYNALCPNVTDIEVLSFTEEAQVNWEAGQYGETEWTVIFGETGFDPATEGTTQTTTDPFIQLAPLTENTTYDVYIFSECQLDSITSDGTMTSFTTNPYCSNPVDISADTYEDSLDISWDWTINNEPGVPVDITGFNIQYGSFGFELGTGTIDPATGVDFTDTVIDGDLIAGGVYQIYVQAICGTDSSAYSGPITVVMPLTNDDPCGAQLLAADGTVYTLNNTGATVATGESAIAPAVAGAQSTEGWINSTLNNTTWFKFVAPASGNVRVNNTAVSYNGQAAVYFTSDCANYGAYSVINANDNAIGGTSVAPNFTICGLTAGTTYYLLHDGFTASTGNYSISISPINLQAGTVGETANICSGSDVDLFTTISGYDNGGTWSSADGIPSVDASINGSDFASEGLAYVIFDFQYRVEDGCAYDSILSQVQVFAPSTAGEDGSITACRNEPIDLLAGLSGSADLEGTWYDPSGNDLDNSQITTGNFPGGFNYDYIAGNGVCPNDTAIVVVNIGTCDFLGVDEELFAGVAVYPNPSKGTIFISSDVTEAFDYIVTDAKGRVITQKQAAVTASAITEINLDGAETGVYFIRLSNEQTAKTYRVVVQP